MCVYLKFALHFGIFGFRHFCVLNLKNIAETFTCKRDTDTGDISQTSVAIVIINAMLAFRKKCYQLVITFHLYF